MSTNEHSLTTQNEFKQPIGFEIKNWTAKERPAQKPLAGAYCRLTPINLSSDLSALYNALTVNNDGASWTYLPYGPFNELADFNSWLVSTLTREPDTQLYSIEKLNDPTPVGIIGYLRINPEHGVIEIGHVHFSKLLQKTAAATEAIFLMINHALNDLGYRRCEWKCNSLNQASINTALRIGFKFEGTFRQSNVFKSQNRDTSWFSIIDTEWPALATRISTWLDPSNFDAEGIQRVALQELKG
ncbi:GNAT family N-acetyltransferase [Legionella sp. km772]|uniref:GNAT family N-acetyltransferase n=1 Tax=Legionella sp. km772 TaxID=2498111 RepID=UPI000F8DB03B|nr:GNAT family protein [Legionella sp. km772]RUR13012.1 N-acetyltransferase [Legionella sp. km772]